VGLTAERTATAVPLSLAMSRATGGVAGLSPVVAIRDGASLTSWLDFADNTFKAAGWTTRQASMTDLTGGFYGRTLSLAAITNLPAATDHLVAEYAVTAGSLRGVSVEVVTIVAALDLLGTAVEGSLTVAQLLRLIGAANLGKTTGVGSATETFKAADGAASRVVTTIDGDGNRAAVVLTP
jgi:hypothetical protein